MLELYECLLEALQSGPRLERCRIAVEEKGKTLVPAPEDGPLIAQSTIVE